MDFIDLKQQIRKTYNKGIGELPQDLGVSYNSLNNNQLNEIRPISSRTEIPVEINPISVRKRVKSSPKDTFINLRESPVIKDRMKDRISGRVVSDSRRVQVGDVFVAVRGVTMDGHEFVGEAIKKGAAVIVADRDIEVPGDVSLVLVENSAIALGELAQASMGCPSNELFSMAVTGTNGKTTVSYLVRKILERSGQKCGMIGTVEYDVGSGEIQKADNTTPDAVQLAWLMRQMRNNSVKAMVMECSSHGLDQDRVSGIGFNAAAFTNLSGDHLDYHQSREAYLAAKSKLFRNLSRESIAVLNRDDAASHTLAELTDAEVWWYGMDESADIHVCINKMDIEGSEYEMSVGGESVEIRTSLIGRHNISNCLCAAGLARAAGVDMGIIRVGIEEFGGVPGRLEKIESGQDFTVLVDYAHTDDALLNVLRSLEPFVRGRMILVFGCGGQRDQSKRPRMARVAEMYADSIIVTNDNPRREDPRQILDHIRAGFSPGGLDKSCEIPDRHEAIAYALDSVQGGDVVLIAGKGHEDYQIIGDRKRHFDDREVVREMLLRRHRGTKAQGHKDF